MISQTPKMPKWLVLGEGNKVADALEAYLSMHDIGLTLEEFQHSRLLLNNQATHPEQLLHDGDELAVLRILGGSYH